MTIKQKLEEIAYAPVTEGDFLVHKNPDKFFYDMCVKAFNLGVMSVSKIKEEKIDYHISPRQTKINFKNDGME